MIKIISIMLTLPVFSLTSLIDLPLEQRGSCSFSGRNNRVSLKKDDKAQCHFDLLLAHHWVPSYKYYTTLCI